MKNLFLLISDALMKEPRRGCRGLIIFWRKIVYVTAILAIVGVFLQSFVFPYPLQNWFLVPPPTTSSNDDLHSTFHVEGTFPPAMLTPSPPVVSSNSSNAISAIIPPVPVMEVRAEISPGKGRDHVDTNKIMPPVPVIEVRAEASQEKGKDHLDTNKITPPVPVIEVRAEASHEKGKDHVDTNKITPPVPVIEVRAEASHAKGKDHVDTDKIIPPVPVIEVRAEASLGKGKDHVDTNKTTPPVPLIEVRAEASHGMGKDHVDTNENNPDKQKLVIQPSPGLVVPHQRDIWSLPPDEALVYAKKELEHAPIVTNDPDLYTPLFRNVSIFKRSYELMENILKVFIYKDGKRPIFHHPHLKGIYASEGWFMKLVEENRQFVTRDPKRAHLFYLPYSSRQLELALYVPESHNVKPLAIFLRNYVNMIAAKYPFWNRTRGADHFLVACHDWGPYTVTEHEELLRNSIKALCAADLSEGIFVSGRDVSLPETTIRKPRKPLRGIGGKRVSQRPILAFFAGNMHGRVRPNLVRYWRDRDEDMRIYGPLPNRVARNMSYAVHMKSSKFCICPMGFEVNSPRIVEAIYNECVPVIIADNFVLPFDDVLEWKSFSLVVAEKDIPKLKDILLAVPMRRYLWMQTNVKMLQKHFLWNPIPIRYDLFHMVLHSIWFNRLNQIQVQHQ